MHQIKGGEIFQLVYSFLTHKHPTIPGAQTSVCLTRDRDARGMRNRGFCHIWLQCCVGMVNDATGKRT